MVAHMARAKGQTGRESRRFGGLSISRLVVAVLLAVAAGLLVPGFSGRAVSETTSSGTGAQSFGAWYAGEADAKVISASAASQVVVPIRFPFQEPRRWEDDFGAPRGSSSHLGNDILAPKGTPLVAVVSGYLDGDFMNFGGTRLSDADGLPYFNIMLCGDDGNDYFYIHLNNDSRGTDGTYTNDGAGGPALAYAPGLHDGVALLHIGAVQRLVQALGAFGRLASVGQAGFMRYILPALQNLLEAADVCGLDAVGGLAEELIARETLMLL